MASFKLCLQLCTLFLAVSFSAGFLDSVFSRSKCQRQQGGTCFQGRNCPTGYQFEDQNVNQNFLLCWGFGVCCVLTDPCVNAGCDANAGCTHDGTTPTCTCNNGWEGNGFTCTDINECDISTPCGDNAICQNLDGGFSCICPSGYISDGANGCVDVDECALNTDNCGGNAACTNTEPSFTCACLPGYQGNPYGADCTDINECDLNIDNCSPFATCSNTGGSFTCACDAGYSGTGVVCTDDNECTLNTDNCGANTVCTNEPGTFSCACADGYQGDPIAGCTDIEECATNTDNCSPFATCSNDIGGFTCTCIDGYVGDGVTCSDIDECATGQNDCGGNTECIDIVGGYVCVCSPGFSGDPYDVCNNVDECAASPGPCGTNAFCQDLEGSFTCACPTGYEGNPFVNCEEINECLRNTDNCDPDATCGNTAGGFTCTCNAGFSGDGVDCTDDDECTLNTDNCGANTVCTNEPGTFSCACADGYQGDPIAGCTNIDECAANTDNCDANAICNDVDGSYDCTCIPGYTGDGFTCNQVDECAAGIDDCVENAVCADLIGSHACTCADGYTGDGFVLCENVDECTQGLDDCTGLATCEDTIGSFVCTCPDGYESLGGTDCTNIDECAAGTDTCDPNAACTDIVPDGTSFYTCACNDGFFGDGFTCVASINDENCGVVFTSRINLGRQSELCQNPWQVAFRTFITPSFFEQPMDTDASFFIGAGVLISPQWVLTNTFAMVRTRIGPDSPPYRLNLFAVIGDYDQSVDESTEQLRRIKEVYFHPNGQFSSGDDFFSLLALGEINPEDITDIQQEYAFALVQLEEPVDITTCVRPACLPFENEYPESCVKTECKTTGWGENSALNAQPILQAADVEVFDRVACEALNYYLGGNTFVPQPGTTECARGPTGAAPCFGDYGGPLVCRDAATSRFVLEDITIMETDLCIDSTGRPFTVARVRDALDFITTTLVENGY